MPTAAEARQSSIALRQRLSIISNRPLLDGHVYSVPELAEIRKLLNVRKKDWPDVRLQLQTDDLVSQFGSRLVFAPRKGRAARQQKLKVSVLEPANALLKGLDNEDIAKEFWNKPRRLPISLYRQLRSQLQLLIKAVKQHATELEWQMTPDRAKILSSRLGRKRLPKRAVRRPWDAKLKREFVYRVAVLCTDINPKVMPTRATKDGQESDTKFTTILKILAAPLFLPHGKSRQVKFTGAMREITRKQEITILERKKPSPDPNPARIADELH